uniref:Si:dkey-34d22.1 n=1 Tax=Fundulus heteroclitus TaxID=8078 RepID=A0A3Q2QCM3_FUNHE
ALISLGPLWELTHFSSVTGADTGNGCGHALLGAESGTLASPNYPGTYPSNAWCKWRLRVPEGRALRLLFGDFDIEGSPGCRNGSVVITGRSGERRLGPVCGKLNATMKNVTLETNEVTVTFMSGPHRSGRGFLLSYATDQHPGAVCLCGASFPPVVLLLSVYCPAGCKDVPGDIWGNSEQGYRDTSVLCKSAVHGGVTSDALGGRVTVTPGRSLTLYESTFQPVYPLFDAVLTGAHYLRRSCFLAEVGESGHDSLLWTADSRDSSPWLEIELTERSTVKGLVTKGSSENYIESYSLHFSKDGKSWKTYKEAASKEKKVFQAYADGHPGALNSLFPPAVARFVRLQPLSWHGSASAQVDVLGCPAAKATPRSHPPGGERILFAQVKYHPSARSSHPAIIAVGVVLGLVMCGSCLLAGILLKTLNLTLCVFTSVGCQGFKGKSLPCPQSELISYPLVRNVHDALPSPHLNAQYAAPIVSAGQKLGSTFRPSSGEGYTTPFTCGPYDTPGSLPEYAEPLPPEPEYATPFSELPPEHKAPTFTGLLHSGAHRPPAHAPSGHSQYDCPSHRVLFNGYCTPALHAGGPRPASEVYAEPRSSDSSGQRPTYEEPL